MVINNSDAGIGAMMKSLNACAACVLFESLVGKQHLSYANKYRNKLMVNPYINKPHRVYHKQ